MVQSMIDSFNATRTWVRDDGQHFQVAGAGPAGLYDSVGGLGDTIVYHTHGLRQYFGTCKLHRDPDCPPLKHWRPGWGSKTIIVEFFGSGDEVPERSRCRRCWKSTEEGQR